MHNPMKTKLILLSALAAIGIAASAQQPNSKLRPDETVYPSDVPMGLAELFATYEFRRA